MITRNKLADLLNVPLEMTFDGRKVELVELDLEHMAKFAEWLGQRAAAKVKQLYLNDPEKLAAQERQVVHDTVAGVYDWGSEVCAKALATIEGQAKAIELSTIQAGKPIDYEDCLTIARNRQNEILQALTEVVTKNPKVLMRMEKGLMPKPSSQSSPRTSNIDRKKSKNSRRRK